MPQGIMPDSARQEESATTYGPINTGVQAVDSKVGNHLVQTVEAARLMGATVILAGVSPGIAQTMVTLGIELGRMTTVGDLQSGIERGEELLGYTVTRTRARSHSA
jgi:rsbT co-antagonist protein RsbR